MTHLPDRFWRVALVRGQGMKLRPYELGAKTYTDETHAHNHLDRLRKRGVGCELWESGPVEWHLVAPDEPIEGQEELW